MDYSPFLSDSGVISLSGKESVLVCCSGSLVGIPCRLALAAVFRIIIFPQPEFGSFGPVVKPVVPLNTLNTFKSVYLLPGIGGTGSLLCQKGIIIGKGGSMLKKIGTEARLDMEDFFEKKVFLKLFVKVDSGWRDEKKELRRFGYES